MKIFIIVLMTNLLSLTSAELKASLNDQSPNTAQWETKDGVKLQATCFTKLGPLGVSEADAAAVIRVFIMNTRDHLIYHLGNDIDYGFHVAGTTASGEVIMLRSKAPMAGRRVELSPNKPQVYNILLSKKDLSFLTNQQLTISAKIGDKTTGQIMVIEAPIVLK